MVQEGGTEWQRCWLALGQEHNFFCFFLRDSEGRVQAPAHCSGQLPMGLSTNVNQIWEWKNALQSFCGVKTSCPPRTEEALPDR